VIYIRPVEERGWPQTVEFVITITVGVARPERQSYGGD
jgi:hypothetical protein